MIDTSLMILPMLVTGTVANIQDFKEDTLMVRSIKASLSIILLIKLYVELGVFWLW